MIALLGASGKIGRNVDSFLKTLDPEIEIRRGSRNGGSKGEGWKSVDIEDEKSLNDFLSGCDIIVNVAGPSEKTGKKVLDYALKNGVTLVDIGDGNCYKEVSDAGNANIIYGSGAVPGVIGLLPRYIAGQLDSVTGLRVDYLINETISMTAALDMTEKMNVVYGVKPRAFASEPESVPFLGDSVHRYRYSDEESKGIDAILKNTNSQWSMVREDDSYEKLLGNQFNNKEELASALVNLSKVSLSERETGIKFFIEMNGTKDGDSCDYSCTAQTGDPAELSGKAVAATVYTVMNTEAKAGICHMSNHPEWNKIWDNLNKLSPFETFYCYPYALSEAEEEDGEI